MNDPEDVLQRETLATIQRVMCEVLGPWAYEVDLGPEVSLWHSDSDESTALALDSIQLLEIVVGLEDEFDVELIDDLENIEIATVATLLELVLSKQPGTANVS